MQAALRLLAAGPLMWSVEAVEKVPARNLRVGLTKRDLIGCPTIDAKVFGGVNGCRNSAKNCRRRNAQGFSTASLDAMNDPYSDIEAIWNHYLSGGSVNTEREIRALLDSQGIRIRQDDGELKQFTISKPTSVTSGFALGLRYVKRGGSQTENHFTFEKGRPIECHYRGSLESKWPEYKGTHKQQVLFALVVDVQDPITLANTISLLKKT